MKSILARKIGMTQIFNDEGIEIPVTVLEAGEVVLAKILDAEKGKVELGKGVDKKASKADVGNYKHLGFAPKFKHVVIAEDLPELGAKVTVAQFEVGDKIKVIGTTKGKGFQGVVKRWGFAGGPKTHGGESGKGRSPGSIAPGQTTGRVYKGTKMGGRMGGDRQTIRGLKIAMIDIESNVIAVSGSIPGPNGSYVIVTTGR